MSTQDTTLPNAFNPASAGANKSTVRTKKVYSPFSIRFSEEERSYLEQLAGNRPLGAYIRERLLEKKAEKRRVLRKPSIEDEQYAALLAALGQSRLSSSLNQLAKQANTGTLDISENIEQQLQDAYHTILAMREALFIALKLKSGGES